MWSFRKMVASMWGLYWMCMALYTSHTDAELISLDGYCQAKWEAINIYPFTCTCRKIDNSTDGSVFWFHPDGTLAPQKLHPGDNIGISSSEMVFNQPPSTKPSHHYICGLMSSSWQRTASLDFSPHFCFGPQSATIRRKDAAENPAPVYTVCTGKSVNVSFECEHPSQLISDTGLFVVYVSNRQPSYGFRVEDVVWSSNVVRAEFTMDLEEGYHEVVCNVYNSCNSDFSAQASLHIAVEKTDC